MKLFPLLLLPLLAASAFAIEATSPAPRKLATPAQRWGNGDLADTPSFRRHVIPLMARAGCSGRECHGAFSGQGGFQLSLFGYHFDKDYEEIVKDKEDGTRIDLQNPAQSLVLTKPSLDGEKHKGKKRIDKGSWEYNVLLKWVAKGAKIDVEETGEFDRLEVTPEELVFKKPGDQIPMRVLAYWKDGTVEDVTQLTRFRTNDESVVEVSPTGVVTCKAPGDTHVVAFYDNGVHPVPAILASSNLTGPNFPKVPTRTKVDELVVNKLRKVGVVPSELCTDAEFLRRVSLDMTATLPTPEQVRAFLKDTRPDKRARKVDELLASPGYAAWWTTLLCDFAGNDPRRLSAPSGDTNFFSELLSRQWYEWLRVRIARNEPYDKIVAGMVLATGRTRPDQTYEEYAKEQSSYFCSTNAADFTARPNMPYFWQRNNIRKAEEKALAFAHTFLGVRIECAQCHKHPFDQWTQTDFQQFQAFFETIQYQPKPAQPNETVTYKTAETAFRDSIPKERLGEQKFRAAEFRRLLDTDFILPWPEVFTQEPKKPKEMNPKALAKLKEKDPNFSSRVLTPKILGGEEVFLTQYKDSREPLMEWMREKNNPYFARSFVNRVWAQYFGRGMVEPADDLNLANPPVNRELMDHLAAGFVAHKFDIKWLHREIVNSDTYQRSWQPTPSNKLDNKNFSRATMRRLPAEVVFDAIRIATLAEGDQAAYAADLTRRAIGSHATNYKGQGRESYALNTFGKPARNMNCDCERTNDPTLLQTLFTRNDPNFLQLIENKREDGDAWVQQVRFATAPEYSPQKIAKEIAGMEADRLKRSKNYAERELKKPMKDKEIERVRKIEENSAERLVRLESDLVQAKKRKPMSLDKIVDDIFLRTVSRPPTAEEKAKAHEDLAAAKSQYEGVRDLLWAMLNTREFIVNH